MVKVSSLKYYEIWMKQFDTVIRPNSNAIFFLSNRFPYPEGIYQGLTKKTVIYKAHQVKVLHFDSLVHARIHTSYTQLESDEALATSD